MQQSSFGEWEKDVKRYCDDNGLSFEKAKSMKTRWGIDFLELIPERSAPEHIALLVCRNMDGSGHCEATEFTQKYLA